MARSLLAFLLCSSAVLGQSGRDVDPRFEVPVIVTSLGPDAVRVRVASGRTMPCDSSSNRMVIDARLDAGQAVRATSNRGCVCFQQTYAPLADSDWSTPQRVCSPCAYNPATRVWVCPPQREPTIAIQVASSRTR